MLYQEAVVWKRLNHPNIVPFHGVTLRPLQLVSNWMQAAELTECIKNTPKTNRLGLVGVLPTALVKFASSLFSSCVMLLRA
jgi:hypothetical protein